MHIRQSKQQVSKQACWNIQLSIKKNPNEQKNKQKTPNSFILMLLQILLIMCGKMFMSHCGFRVTHVILWNNYKCFIKLSKLSYHLVFDSTFYWNVFNLCRWMPVEWWMPKVIVMWKPTLWYPASENSPYSQKGIEKNWKIVKPENVNELHFISSIVVPFFFLKNTE